MGHPRELMPCFAEARRICKRHGTSYYFATQLFVGDIRQATYALYAFFRVPDEIVDGLPLVTIAERDAARRRLADWTANWEKAFAAGDSDDVILRVNAYLFQRYRIPYEYSVAFLDAMDRDLVQRNYCNYSDLKGYMYGSAAVVGLMMAHVLGFTHPERALPGAETLGYAMQMTNFLRDVDEDYQVRRRVYLPQDELASFGLSRRDIAERRFSPAFREFMQFQAERIERLYDEADAAIPLLTPEGRRPVRAASVLYRAILTRLAAQDWNPFVGRARTTLPEKLWLLLQVLRSEQDGSDGSESGCHRERHRGAGSCLPPRPERL